MNTPIRYARTSDGVNIAFGDLGEGEPVIYLPALPWCNFSICLGNPHTLRHPAGIASFARLLIYDARGCGLSDHDAEDLTLEGLARDIDAVAEAAGCERFTLYGSSDASRAAIHYAATRPERVNRLVLWVPSVSAERLRTNPVMRALRPLAEHDWETYICTVSYAVVGGWDASRAPYAAAFADLMRGGIRQEEFPRMAGAMRMHDVSDLLGRIKAPTVVLTREHASLYALPVVREVAAGIPGARLIVCPGSWLLPCTDDNVTLEIARFLGAEFTPGPEAEPGPATNGLAAQSGSTGLLSLREKEVLALVAQGKTNAEVAETLVISPATASRHVHNILNKLGMSRRAEAAAYAALEGLISTGARP